MLLVTFLTNPANELILMKTGWLILNLSDCGMLKIFICDFHLRNSKTIKCFQIIEDVKEEMRVVRGVDQIFQLLAKPEVRYQRLAIKILNNMLVGCTPYANHEGNSNLNSLEIEKNMSTDISISAIAEGTGIFSIVKVALTSSSMDVIYYSLSVISNLVLSGTAFF